MADWGERVDLQARRDILLDDERYLRAERRAELDAVKADVSNRYVIVY